MNEMVMSKEMVRVTIGGRSFWPRSIGENKTELITDDEEMKAMLCMLDLKYPEVVRLKVLYDEPDADYYSIDEEGHVQLGVDMEGPATFTILPDRIEIFVVPGSAGIGFRFYEEEEEERLGS